MRSRLRCQRSALLLQCAGLTSDSSDARSARRAGFHSKCKVVAIEVDDVKVAHPIILVLRGLDQLCPAFGKFGVNTIDILYEHADAAVARQLLCLVRREQV